MANDDARLAEGWAGPALVAAGALLAAIVGTALTRAAGNVASLWIANAVLLAALVTRPPGRWPRHVLAFVAGNVAANLAAGDAPALSLGFGAVNAAEALVAALALRRMGSDDLDLERRGDLLAFAACAGVAAPVAGATLGAGLVAAATGSPYAAVWPTWFMADALGNLMVAPLLVLGIGVWRRRDGIARADLLEMAGAAALMTAATLLVFFQRGFTIGFLIVPPAIVATYRAGAIGATVATAVVSVLGGIATAADLGPMALVDGGKGMEMRMMQLLILTLFVSTMPLAVVLAERRGFEDRLRAAALRDALTGLTNRAGLMAHLAETLAAPARPSLLVVDVDHFKAVNDQHGHIVGDQVLEAVSQVMRRSLRGGDLLARLGGEEFVVVLPNTPLAVARQVAERLRRAVEERPEGGVWLPPVTVSVGAAEAQAGETAGEVLSRADHALYAAKHGGRNRVELAA